MKKIAFFTLFIFTCSAPAVVAQSSAIYIAPAVSKKIDTLDISKGVSLSRSNKVINGKIKVRIDDVVSGKDTFWMLENQFSTLVKKVEITAVRVYLEGGVLCEYVDNEY